ncbi:MAG: amidase [Proteobacteria bacterium]|nr:amidase [Pseudomonadota bacterium]
MSRAFEHEEATVASVHKAFADGALTCVKLTQAYLGRIAALDRQGPKLNAVIAVNPKALETAEALDRMWRENRAACGPLHGIPILLKDNFDTADMPTTGSALALKDSRPKKDAFTVARLRAAGALVLAKTTLTELAMGGTTTGSLHGQTLNPYDVTRTPGGSSGGTGAGIAANYAVFGTGSDTYQSIRSPSSACALVGLRGTRGLVSRSGLIPFSFTQDEAGPIARSAADLARALDVMAGFDPSDPVTDGAVGHMPKSYTAFLDPGALKGKRLGVLRQVFGNDVVHAEVNRVMTRVLDKLLELGAIVFDVEILDLEGLTTDVGLADYELKAGLDKYLAHIGGSTKSFDDYVAHGAYPSVVAAQVEAARRRGMRDPDYAAIFIKRGNLRKALHAAMSEHRLDAFVYPHQKRLVAKVGDEQLERNGVLANASGMPVITIPGGFSSATDDAPLGIPVGVEFLGREWSEGMLIGIAHAFERATKHRRPPKFPS